MSDHPVVSVHYCPCCQAPLEACASCKRVKQQPFDLRVVLAELEEHLLRRHRDTGKVWSSYYYVLQPLRQFSRFMGDSLVARKELRAMGLEWSE